MSNAPNGMTKRERYTLAGHADKIPQADVDAPYQYIIGWFWELRSYLDGHFSAITPDCINLWLPDKYPSHDECGIILAMDRAYRIARQEIDAENDKRRANK